MWSLFTLCKTSQSVQPSFKVFLSCILCRRKKGKGKKAGAKSRETDTCSQESRVQPEEGESSRTVINETANDVEHEGTTEDTRAADRLNALAHESSQTSLVSCTPLNTPSHLVYGPLNPVVTSSLNSNPGQRMPAVLGFANSLGVQQQPTNSVQSSQPAASPSVIGLPVRLPGTSSYEAGERNGFVRRNFNTFSGSALNSQAVASPSGNLSTISAQQLQQVVISRMLAPPLPSESTETGGAFLPPNVNVPHVNPNTPPRASILLPHVHSLLNPPGINSAGGEVTVWPFAPNNHMFQQ